MGFFEKWNSYRTMASLKWKSVFIFIFLSLISSVLEAFGLGIFYPIFQYIQADGNLDVLVSQSSMWNYLVNIFNILNINMSLVILLITAFMLFTFRQIFVFIRLVYITRIGKNLEKELKDKLFNFYLHSSSSFHNLLPIGKFANIISQEVRFAIAGTMSPLDLITQLIMLLTFTSLLLIMSWEMTLFALVILAIAINLQKFWIKKSEIVGKEVVKANNLMTTFLIDRLRSPRLVKLSGMEDAQKQEFSELTNIQKDGMIGASILQSKTEVVMEPIVIGLSLVFLYFAVTIIYLPIEMVGLYMLVSMRLLPVVKSIVKQWQKIKGSLGSIGVVENHLMQMKDNKEKDNGKKIINSMDRGIEFKQVFFKYSVDSDIVLNNININIPAGKLTAIVGPSGSGKSTLVDLLPRLTNPDSGDILFDSTSVKEFTLKSLRSYISYVSQAPQIFNTTILQHIRHGKNNANLVEVKDSAKLAGIDSFIDSLANGYDTYLGENAVRLSGGQRQRLDLARALISRSPVLILDEPTSNLDFESEYDFMNSLFSICRETDTTIIIITHRLYGISNADNIIVINNGKVESEGSHEHVVRESNWYKKAHKIHSDKPNYASKSKQ
jgi:ABC-type multidrug transport system fused ATPase/permease subunit